MIAAFERFEIELTLPQALACSHQGPCDADVEQVTRDLRVMRALAHIDPDRLRAELREYGAWDADELDDYEQNLRRIVWIAAGNIREEL